MRGASNSSMTISELEWLPLWTHIELCAWRRRQRFARSSHRFQVFVWLSPDAEPRKSGWFRMQIRRFLLRRNRRQSSLIGLVHRGRKGPFPPQPDSCSVGLDVR
jgi:hypothetical protein